MKKVLNELKLKDEDELYLSIGSLRYTAYYIINILNEDKKDIADIMLDRVNKKTFEKVNYKNDIIVAGTDNILVNLAKCCNPVPGDEIVGYITKGEGVSVHKKNCPNMKGIETRIIDVEWNVQNENKLFITNIYIKTNSMKNHLLDLVTCASTRNISINSINEKENNGVINYEVSVKIQNTNELSLFIEDLRNLDFVLEVIR